MYFRVQPIKSVFLTGSLVALSVALLGCSPFIDSPMVGSSSKDSMGMVAAQGFQDVAEVRESERDAAIRQALDDWRTQGMRSFLKEERGQSLDRMNAQVFSFRRGAHDGQIVLLPYGDRMLSYVQFGKLRDVMLTQRKSSTQFAPVRRPQLRNEIMKQLRDDAFPWLGDQLGRRIVPGQTLLLHDSKKGQTLYFVLPNPNKPNKGRGKGPNGVEAQQEMLTTYSGGGGYACCSTSSDPVDSDTTSTTTYDYEPDPGCTSCEVSYTAPSLSTEANASTSVAHKIPCSLSEPLCVQATITADGAHSGSTGSVVDNLSVNGAISFIKGDSCSSSGSSTSEENCSTHLDDVVSFWTNECTKFTASGETNAGYSDLNYVTGETVLQSGHSSATSEITFNCN